MLFRKSLITVLVVLMTLTSMVSASGKKEVKKNDFSKVELNKVFPQELREKNSQPGTVEQVNYKTFLYAYDVYNNLEKEDWHEIEKTAYVYLPYGYDSSKKYPVYYLLHGGGTNETTWLGVQLQGEMTQDEKGAYQWAREFLNPGEGDLPNMLDNLIASKTIEPMIIVTPTMYYEGSEFDFELPERRSRETWCEYFSLELQNELIPAIEGKYSTYAESTDKEDLIKSRDYRAIGGLSMGSITTWRSGLKRSLPYFSSIMNYSAGTDAGPLAHTFENTKDVLDYISTDEMKDYDINLLLSFNGTADVAHDPHVVTYHHLVDMSDGRLVDGENAAFFDFEGYVHDYYAWLTYFYYTSLVLFK